MMKEMFQLLQIFFVLWFTMRTHYFIYHEVGTGFETSGHPHDKVQSISFS